MKNRDLLFIDVETTHLNPAIGEIIEIAIIRDDGVSSRRYVTKIRPENLHVADRRSLEINGYNEKEWFDAPRASEIAQDIGYFIQGGLFVGHNVHFDYEWIEEFLHQHKVPMRASYRKIDTMTLAHEHLPFLSSHSLKTIREFFDISTLGSHRAEKDVEDMRWIYYRLRRASVFSRLYWRIKHWYKTNRQIPRILK